MADDLDIPPFLRLSADERRAGWAEYDRAQLEKRATQMTKIGPKEAQTRAMRETNATTKSTRAGKNIKTSPPEASLGDILGAALNAEPKPPSTVQPTAEATEPKPDNKESAMRTTTSKKAAKAKARTAVKAKTKNASGERARFDWAGAEEKAAKGIVPAAPDFSAKTHEPFRDKLAEVVKAARAKDLDALAKIKIKPTSSSPKAIDRYRKICIAAIKAA